MVKQRYIVNIVKPSILNLNRAAEYLGVSAYFLRNLVATGVIPCVSMQNGKSTRKTYAFTQSALDNWAQNINNRIER